VFGNVNLSGCLGRVCPPYLQTCTIAMKGGAVRALSGRRSRLVDLGFGLFVVCFGTVS
jgi:hypothetical protein